MRKNIKAPMRAEVVCWIDHSEPVNKTAWDVPTHPDHLYPCVVFSTGFVLSENDQVLEIARDISEYGSIGAALHILKKCIIYRKLIRVPDSKTRLPHNLK